MIDPDKASMAGLKRPAAAVCRRCHDNDEADHDRGFVMPTETDREVWVHIREEP